METFSPSTVEYCTSVNKSKEQTSIASLEQSKCQSSIQACKTRSILTPSQAAEIFKIHLLDRSSLRAKDKWLSSTKVASVFGVSEKTVRDIWTGRTWFHELIHLDPARASLAEKRMRPPGRPMQVGCAEKGNRVMKSRNQRPSLLPSRVTTLSASSTASDDVSDVVEASSIHSSTIGCDGISACCSQPPCQSVHSVVGDCPPTSVGDAGFEEWYDEQLPDMCTVEEAAPLPGSSCPDDPFHDDWGYWPALDHDMDNAFPAAVQAATELVAQAVD